MKIFKAIIILILSFVLVSTRVIKYEHNLEFIKYDVDNANSQEENHLSVQIYTIKAMESKFNKLTDELKKQQQQLFDKNKINSENSLKQFNEEAQKSNEKFMKIIKLVKENLNDFKSARNKMEAKKVNITRDYMMEILTYENDLNVKLLICKNSTDQLNKENKFLTKILDGCTNCKEERIENLKRELQAASKNLRMESDYCEESAQFLREKLNKLRSNMTDEVINLLNIKNQKFEEIIERFYNLSNLESLLNDSKQSNVNFLSGKEQLESNLQEKLSNLNSMLIFDSIKPKSGEVIYHTNENQLEDENFIQDFLIKINGKENDQQPLVFQSLNVEEPAYVKWEKIHEKTRFVPENSVIAGYDVDGAILHVVRACKDNQCTYGKYARSDSRRNAYIPYDSEEKGVQDVELLTTPHYKWCSYDKNKNYDNLPVCRVEYKSSITPGTLANDGKCRIGYGWKIVLVENNIEVLGINQC